MIIKSAMPTATYYAGKIKTCAEVASETKYNVSLSQNNKPATGMCEAYDMLDREIADILASLIDDTQKIYKTAEMLGDADKFSAGKVAE